MLGESKIARGTSECLFICRRSNPNFPFQKKLYCKYSIRSSNSVPFHEYGVYVKLLDRSSCSVFSFQGKAENHLSTKSGGYMLLLSAVIPYGFCESSRL